MDEKQLKELYNSIDWHNPPSPIFYTDENDEYKILNYKLSEDKQKIVDSLSYETKPRFVTPLACSKEERFYADFLLANRISSNNQWKQTVLKRSAEMKRVNLARKIYKRLINWLRK